jgi:hypothetical protein
VELQQLWTQLVITHPGEQALLHLRLLFLLVLRFELRALCLPDMLCTFCPASGPFCFSFYFFLWSWGLNSGELPAWLVGTHSIAWVMLPAFSSLDIGSHFFLRTAVLPAFYFTLPSIAGMAGVCHHSQSSLLRWSLVNILHPAPSLALNCDPPDLSLPTS